MWINRDALRAASRSLRAASGCAGVWNPGTSVHRRLWWWYRLHKVLGRYDREIHS